MANEMSKELTIIPASDDVREELDDSDGWRSYAKVLHSILETVTTSAGVNFLEVDGLLANRPLSGPDAEIRNGSNIRIPCAIRLIEGMAAGRGPYCQLSVAGRIQIESGWDGAVHVYMTPSAAAEMPPPCCLHEQDGTNCESSNRPNRSQV